jgi:hypothetical protein
VSRTQDRRLTPWFFQPQLALPRSRGGNGVASGSTKRAAVANVDIVAAVVRLRGAGNGRDLSDGTLGVDDG